MALLEGWCWIYINVGRIQPSYWQRKACDIHLLMYGYTWHYGPSVTEECCPHQWRLTSHSGFIFISYPINNFESPTTATCANSTNIRFNTTAHFMGLIWILFNLYGPKSSFLRKDVSDIYIIFWQPVDFTMTDVGVFRDCSIKQENEFQGTPKQLMSPLQRLCVYAAP